MESQSHAEIVKKVIGWLQSQDFATVKAPNLPVTDERTALALALLHKVRKGRKWRVRLPDWIIKPDILGGKGDYAGLATGDSGVTIAVEVSVSSDLKREVDKLRKLPVNRRLIVTRSFAQEGEVGGIPVISIDNLDDDLKKWLLSGRIAPLRALIQKRR